MRNTTKKPALSKGRAAISCYHLMFPWHSHATAYEVSNNTPGQYRCLPSKPTPFRFQFAAPRCIPVLLHAPLTNRQLSVKSVRTVLFLFVAFLIYEHIITMTKGNVNHKANVLCKIPGISSRKNSYTDSFFRLFIHHQLNHGLIQSIHGKLIHGKHFLHRRLSLPPGSTTRRHLGI